MESGREARKERRRLVKKVASVTILTVAPIKKCQTLFGLVLGILPMVLSQLMRTMCKLALLTIRT